ncbi:hypothetical protein HJFPF1_12411 [Paramyrothecium foliicola]|nr:hypothetical protein HJFPF1_12411 [Paramyrothecium foliicola]
MNFSDEKRLPTTSGNNGPESLESPAIPEHTIIGGYQIGRRIREANHATVYAVNLVSQTPGAGLDAYEARIFNLEGLSPSYERYRRRAMKRLSARSIFSVKWGNHSIVVYKTDTALPASETLKNRLKMGHGEAPLAKSEVARTSSKPLKNNRTRSISRQESQRFRQRDRRRANRQCKGCFDTPRRSLPLQRSEPIHPNQDLFQIQERDFVVFTILRVAQDEPWKKVSPYAVPDGTKLAIQECCKPKTLSDYLVDGYDESYLQELIDLKRREVVSLKRKNNKYKPLKSLWHQALNEIFQQTTRIPAKSPEWYKMQQEVIGPSQAKFRVLQAALKALPGIIERAEDIIHALQEILTRKEQERVEREQQETLTQTRTLALAQIRKYRTFLPLVVPGSEDFAKVEADLKKAEDDLSKLDLD